MTMTMTRAGIRPSAVLILGQHIEKAHLKLKNSLTLNGEDREHLLCVVPVELIGKEFRTADKLTTYMYMRG